MTQNCQRSVVQLDLEPPRPYNAGSCGSCLPIPDDAPARERGDHGRERGDDAGRDRQPVARLQRPMRPPKTYAGLPATSRNTSPIAVEEPDVATLTCSRLRQAIGDKSTFCSLVDDQCPTQCSATSDCATSSDCKSCSQ